MVLVALGLGLRVSEIVGLKWGDIDFKGLSLLVRRSVVHGRADSVKTEYSHDSVPLDADLGKVLLKWGEQTPFRNPMDWVVANPKTVEPYPQKQIQKKHLRPAAEKAGVGAGVGWHTFRHTYWSWLDETGAPLKVQQEPMRHASVQTTMNVYGKGMNNPKREAISKVVKSVLPVAVGQEQPPEKEKGLLPAPLSRPALQVAL